MEERDINTYTSYNVQIVNARVAATPIYAVRSGRLYPGAQVVFVEHWFAPAAFTLYTRYLMEV